MTQSVCDRTPSEARSASQSAAQPQSSTTGERAGAQLFVAGVFPNAAAAEAGLADLATHATPRCGLLYINEALDGPALRQAIARDAAFAAAPWGQLQMQGLEDMLDRIGRCLIEGAAVVLLRVETTERQRAASRILLDSRCKLVLTSDVCAQR